MQHFERTDANQERPALKNAAIYYSPGNVATVKIRDKLSDRNIA